MENERVLLVFTDSVALPRSFGAEKVSWKETYIARLQEQMPEFRVINVSIGGASITDLRNQVNYYKVLSPDLVILQCGIVDAAPRAFGRIEMELIKKLKLFRLTKYFVSFLRKYRAHHYASPARFEKMLVEMKDQLQAKRFIAFGIVPAMLGYEKQLPGITRSIETYNGILQRNTTFVSLADMPESGIFPDFHHINAKGQDFLFHRLIQVIRQGDNFAQ